MNGSRDDEELGVPVPRDSRVSDPWEIFEETDPWPGATDEAPELPVGDDDALALKRRNSSGNATAAPEATNTLYLHQRDGRRRTMRAHAREPGGGRRFAHATAAVVTLSAILLIVGVSVAGVVVNWHWIVQTFAPQSPNVFWGKMLLSGILVWGAVAFVALGFIGFVAHLLWRLVAGHPVEEIEEQKDWFDDS